MAKITDNEALARFGPPFVIQARADLDMQGGDITLSLVGGNGSFKRVLAGVKVRHLTADYYEVTQVRPVLDREQDRQALEQFRRTLWPAHS